jgi:hypothetical protein
LWVSCTVRDEDAQLCVTPEYRETTRHSSAREDLAGPKSQHAPPPDASAARAARAEVRAT